MDFTVKLESYLEQGEEDVTCAGLTAFILSLRSTGRTVLEEGCVWRKSCCGAGAGVGGGRRGRERAALVMLWGEAGLRGWPVAGQMHVMGIAVVDPPQAGQTLGNASRLGLRHWAR